VQSLSEDAKIIPVKLPAAKTGGNLSNSFLQLLIAISQLWIGIKS
jgi:hypothetical protein